LATLTIAELQDSLNIPLNPTTTEAAGQVLKFMYLPTSNLKVDQEYQRLVSKEAILKYGTLKRNCLQTAFVSRRPESCGDFKGDYLVDGQHKGIMNFCSGLENENDKTSWMPCMVLDWPEGTPLSEIKKGEAELWVANNFNRKKPSKVDQYRAAVMFDDEEALTIQTYLINLNLVIDNFGSVDDDALELYTPNPFFYTVLEDLNKDLSKINRALGGLNLYKKIYGATKFHGQCFRTMVLLKDFMDRGLTNSRQKKFKEWIINQEGGLKTVFSPHELIKNFGAFAGPRYILHDRIIESYNLYNRRTQGRNASSYNISAETLTKAALIDKKFLHPEADK
jgi:hypothetical protein